MGMANEMSQTKNRPKLRRRLNTNPVCPECVGLTQKIGFLPTRQGKKQMYRCKECGRRFTQDEAI
jgi:transposase-like protein